MAEEGTQNKCRPAPAPRPSPQAPSLPYNRNARGRVWVRAVGQGRGGTLMKTAGKSVLAKEKETQILSLKNHTDTKTNCLCGWMKGLHEPPPSSLLEINAVSSPTPELQSAPRRSATWGPELWDGNPGLSQAVASLTSRMSWLFFRDPQAAGLVVSLQISQEGPWERLLPCLWATVRLWAGARGSFLGGF